MTHDQIGTNYTVPLFINGEARQTKDTFKVVSPTTGEVVHHCASASVEDAEEAVSAAAEAFKSWRQTKPGERRDIILKAAEVMSKRREELVKCITSETGATVGWGHFNVDLAMEFTKDIAGRVSGIQGSFPPTRDADISAIVMKQPYGVVLAIAPW